MADKKITDLPEIPEVADDDYLEIVDVSAGTSNKIKVVDLTGLFGTWQSFISTVSPTSGAFSDMTREAFYCRIGKIVFVRIAILLTNNGTGAGSITFTLPSTPAAAYRDMFSGWSGIITSGVFQFPVIGNVNNVALRRVAFYKIDGTYPGVTGNFYLFNGFYREA